MAGNLYDIVYLLYTIGMVLAMSCVAVILLQRPSTEQKLILMAAVLCTVVWFGYWGEIQAFDVTFQVFTNKLKYIGSCFIYYALLMFCLKYYHITMNQKFSNALLALSGFMAIVAVTLDRHPLMYRSYELQIENGFPTLVKNYGPLHTVYIVMIAFYSLLLLYYYFAKIWKQDREKRFSGMVFFLVMFVPTFCYIIEKIHQPPFDIVPFGLLSTDLFMIYLVVGRRICDVGHSAKELVFNSIEDAVIVVDEKMCYQGANQFAMTIFPELKKAEQGNSIQKESPFIYRLIQESIHPGAVEKHDIEIDGKSFESSLRGVYEDHKLIGYALWLDDVTLLRKNSILVENYQKNLEKDVQVKTQQIQQMQERMIHGFATLIENKDFVTGGHINRTSEYVYAVAKELNVEGYYKDIIEDDFVERIRLVAPLHDIGKMAVPDIVLDKPGKLTREEFEIVKKHSMQGARIIERTMSSTNDPEAFQMAKDVAEFHHEKWNGQGYPVGLSKQEIPLAARIMAVADVFDALVSKRSYKEPFTMDEAFKIIEEESGKHFDPVVVQAFLHIRSTIEELHERLSDNVE